VTTIITIITNATAIRVTACLTPLTAITVTPTALATRT
jgi:hypothetical protein